MAVREIWQFGVIPPDIDLETSQVKTLVLRNKKYEMYGFAALFVHLEREYFT